MTIFGLSIDINLSLRYVKTLPLEILVNKTFTDVDKIMTNTAKKPPAKQLTERHEKLTHTENIKVISHVQREFEEWFLNTLMLENTDVPFKYKRKKLYKNLQGQHVNITYYPENEKVAGFDIEIMKIVRIKVA